MATVADSRTEELRVERVARPEQQPLVPAQPRTRESQGLIKAPGFPVVLLVSCLSACLGSFSFGYSVGFTSPALVPLRQELHLSDAGGSLFSSLVPLGAMPGALAAGPFSEFFGRRTALGAAALLLALHWLLIASSRVILVQLLSRFLGGLGVGIVSLAVPVYVAEVASGSLRGALGSCNQLLITMGTATVYALGLAWLPPPPPGLGTVAVSAQADATSWRLLAWAGVVPAVGLLAASLLIPESPRWLARHAPPAVVARALWALRGLPERCLRIPRKWECQGGADPSPSPSPLHASGAVGGDSVVEEGGGAGEEVRPIQDAAEEGHVGAGALVELESILAAAAEQREAAAAAAGRTGGGQSSYRTLLLPSNLKPLLVGVGLMVVQQLSGINAVIFFSASIFAAAGFTNPNIPSCTLALVQVVMTLVSTLVIDRVGRRPLLLLSSSGMGLSSLTLGLCFFLRHHSGGPPSTHNALLPPSASLLEFPGGAFSRGLHSLPLPTAPAHALAAGALTAPLVGADGGVEALGMLSALCCILFIVAFALGLGPIPWLIMAEVLPAPVKGIASSIVVVVNWSLCFTITQTFAALAAWSPGGVFWMYSAVCFLGAGFIFSSVPETKGRSLEEISHFFA